MVHFLLYAFLTTCASASSLHLRPDGSFKIVQIADMHIQNGVLSGCVDITDEQKKYPCSDLNTTAFINRMILKEDPDLVIFTGDNIVGGSLDSKKSCQMAFGPSIDAKIPWAATLGNHDEQAPIHNRTELMEYITTLPSTLSMIGPSSLSTVDRPVGGNFRLNVLRNDSSSALTLYFLDSGDYSKVPSVSGYDWLHEDQIAWFLKESANVTATALAQGKPIPPGIVFFHIPLPEYNDMLAAKVPISGDYQEGVCSAHVNSGMFAAIKQAGDVISTIVGHDHVNDFCGKWMDVHLCYGGGTGYHAYGKAGWPRRSRVLHLSEKEGRLWTWKRLDVSNLTVIDKEILYGSTPLGNLTLVAGSSHTVECPPGFEKSTFDLNAGVGGDYVYLCFKHLESSPAGTPAVADAVISLKNCPSGYTKIDTHNSGDPIFMCVSIKTTGDIIENIVIVIGSANCPKGYAKDPQNLDQGKIGHFAYMCTKKISRTHWLSSGIRKPVHWNGGLPRKDKANDGSFRMVSDEDRWNL